MRRVTRFLHLEFRLSAGRFGFDRIGIGEGCCPVILSSTLIRNFGSLGDEAHARRVDRGFGRALVACWWLGTAVAYRAIVERWGGDPRGTLIAAATVGISFFISMNLLLAWDERRRRRLGQQENGPQ